MSEKTTTSSGGIGVLGLLGVAFVVLKLTGFIDWSWWWVTAPFWGGLALAAVIFGGALLVVACSAWLSKR
jgi:phosphoglycerol transferase MdoB-like AlkP superfamily enzyme